MKKIFINTPYSRDPNSFWRCMGPLSYLAKASEGSIQIVLPPDGQSIAWDRIAEFDLIYLHRPCRPDDLKLLQLAKLLNIPTWSDYDDWLFHLPDWNPAQAIYHNSTIQTIMATIIACSDIVTVSTTGLLNQMKKLNDRVMILPNAYRSDLFPYRSKEPPTRVDSYLWRGTNTHDGDLLSVQHAFPYLTKKLHLLGGAPYAITSKMDPERYQRHENVDLLLYWKKIYQMAPKAWVSPLDECFFNECKSNISWIESLHAGSLCIAPDMPEWRHPGVVTYKPNDSESFLQACTDVMEMEPVRYRKTVEEAFQYMSSKFGINVVNGMREAIFQSIFQPTFVKNQRDAFNNLTGVWALNVLKSVDEVKEKPLDC